LPNPQTSHIDWGYQPGFKSSRIYIKAERTEVSYLTNQ